MPIVVGIALALMVAAFARLVGFDRGRAFYPTVLMVIASYYLLFAVMADDRAGLLTELLFFAPFTAAAVLGFRSSLWIVVGGLVSHGVFDFVRPSLLEGRGVPPWWPGFCMGFDVAAGLGLAALLLMEKRSRH